VRPNRRAKLAAAIAPIAIAAAAAAKAEGTKVLIEAVELDSIAACQDLCGRAAIKIAVAAALAVLGALPE